MRLFLAPRSLVRFATAAAIAMPLSAAPSFARPEAVRSVFRQQRVTTVQLPADAAFTTRLGVFAGGPPCELRLAALNEPGLLWPGCAGPTALPIPGTRAYGNPMARPGLGIPLGGVGTGAFILNQAGTFGPCSSLFELHRMSAASEDHMAGAVAPPAGLGCLLGRRRRRTPTIRVRGF